MSNKDDSMRRPAKGPRIGLAQIAPALGDLASNMERHRSAVEKAVVDGCDLLVFPELSLAGYRLKDSVPDVGITRGGETWKELEKLSEQVALVIGFVEETSDHLFYNSAGYFEGGKCLAVHRKTYLPTYGMFDEQRYFARGRGIAAFDTKCGRIALLVCEDMLHPSAVTIAACDGATLLVVPSASPARGVTTEGEADSNARSWETYLQVMARSFGLWVVYCNRVGVEDGVSFWGGGEIVSPAGERLVKAAYYDEDYVSAVLSDDAVRRRRIVNPLVRDEDLDLTINELSRIRGRAVEKPAAEKDRGFDRGFEEGPPRPRRFDRDDEERRPAKPFAGKRDFAKPRFDEGEQGSERPRFAGVTRGRFGAREDAPPRERFKPREGSDAPRGRFGNPREGDDAPRGRFGKPRDGDDAPRGRFGPRDGGDAPRGRFGKTHGGDEDTRGRFGKPRDGGDAPRGRFGGAQGSDQRDAPRGRFGDKPQGGGGFGPPRGGGFGPPRGGGFAPPRPGGFGPPKRTTGGGFKDDRGGEGRSFKPRFGDGPPRQRQRPEPSRKPFHKGGKPKGRGRKDD